MMDLSKTQSKDYSFKPDFKYRHRNPYHEKLAQFNHLVLRDNEPETFKGKWSEIFQNDRPIHVEIGSGYGHFMRDFCQNNPQYNYIGLDYRFKRSFELAKKLNRLNLKNIRFLRAKGERVSYLFGPNEIDTLYLFFPDPWPKLRHHKKRLFQLPFLEEAAKVIRPGGTFFIKTDHAGYARHMSECINETKQFHLELLSLNLRDEYPEHFLTQYKTKFEKIFIEQKTAIKAFVLKRL